MIRGYTMTVKDIEKSCCCKYAKWERNSSESTTAWIECSLQSKSTDPDHCAECKERENVRSERA